MDNRPILNVGAFQKEAAFTGKVLNLLEKHYYIFIGSKNGTYDNIEIENKVYKKVKKQLGTMTTKQQHISEAVFDSFSGAMLMLGNSKAVFDMLRLQFGSPSEPMETDDDYVPEAIRLKKATVNIMLDEEMGDFTKLHSFEIEYFFNEQIFKMAQDWVDKNIKYPSELERLHLEVLDHE